MSGREDIFQSRQGRSSPNMYSMPHHGVQGISVRPTSPLPKFTGVRSALARSVASSTGGSAYGSPRSDFTTHSSVHGGDSTYGSDLMFEDQDRSTQDGSVQNSVHGGDSTREITM